jgi:hypothetical protein
MAIWISVTAAHARAAHRLEQDLRLTLGVGLQIVPFRFDAGLAPAQNAKTLIALLAHHKDVSGVIAYEIEAMRLFEFIPAHLRRIFAPFEIPGWNPALTPSAMTGIVDNLLALKPLARHVEVCMPQTRALASAADAVFPGNTMQVPLPFAAPTAAARDKGISLGILADMSADGVKMLAAFLAALTDGHDEADPAPVRVYAPAEFFHTQHFQILHTIPGVTLIEGMAPDNRADAGGDFLVDTAADLHRLDMSARTAAIAGAALLILDGDDGRDVKILDATGAVVPLEKFRADADFRLALRKKFSARAAQIAADANAFWRETLSGERSSDAKAPDSGFLDAAIYAAFTGDKLERDIAALRSVMIAPASAQAALNLADVYARDDNDAAWSLIALASRLARGSAQAPSRPSNFIAGGERLFASAGDHSFQQRSALQKWLESLPISQNRAAPAPREHTAIFNAANDDSIAYSVGLSIDAQGERQIGPDGALLFLKTDDFAGAKDLAVMMEVRLVGDQHAGFLAIDVQGNTKTIALTQYVPCQIQIRAQMPEDGAIGLPVKLAPSHALSRIVLMDIGIAPAEEEDIANDALAPMGFDTLEILPVETAVLSGAFAVEHDHNDAPFRWVSRELMLELPGAPETTDEKESPARWLILKLRPSPSGRSEPFAAEINLRAGGKTIPLRALGVLDNNIMLGAPIGELKSGGTVRINFRAQNRPLSTMDGRLAAAMLSGIWIAARTRTQATKAPPQLVRLDLGDSTAFASGWHPVERVRGQTSRWMMRESLLPGAHSPKAGAKIFLALAGPVLRGNPTLTPLQAMLDGQPMSLRSKIETAEGWALLFEGAAQAETGEPFQIELIAGSARVLGPNDPREVSLLVNFAALLDPAGAAADNALGDAAVLNCELIHEHWGGGLSGAWLPSTVSIACACPDGMDEIVIEGAAATEVAAAEGLTLEIGGKRVEAKIVTAKDGSWVLRAALPKDEQGSASLLQLSSPGDGRVMLRHIGFARRAEA